MDLIERVYIPKGLPSPNSQMLPISRLQIWIAAAALLTALILRADLLWNGGRRMLAESIVHNSAMG